MAMFLNGQNLYNENIVNIVRLPCIPEVNANFKWNYQTIIFYIKVAAY